MGGNSSKSKKSRATGSKYELSHTVDNAAATTNEPTVNNNFSKKDRNSQKKKKTKSETKSSLKRKPDKKSRSKSFRSNEAESNLKTFCVMSETGGVRLELPNSSVYRKKSSCPSCEAKDFLLLHSKQRSSLELRFSDFNKMSRKTRVYDWEMIPKDIPLYGVEEVKAEEVCYICGVYTGNNVRVCHVCCRAFHDGCLSKIGYSFTEKARRLIVANHWSCHQCSSLNCLLTQEEVQKVMTDLQNFGISKENITEEDYLKYCQLSVQQEDKMFTAEKKENSIMRFRSVCHGKLVVISWTQFLNIESIRILNKRCKDSLVHLLTTAEISEARKIFQPFDKDKTGVTSKSTIHALLDSNKSRTSTYYPDDSMMYIDEDAESPVTWADFLRDRAIYFLGQRPNMQPEGTDGTDSCDDDLGNLPSSSFDSLDDDTYNTCNSDLEPNSKDCHICTSKSKDDGTNINNSDDRLSSHNTSSNMLKEIDSEMAKCCKKQEIPSTKDRLLVCGSRFSKIAHTSNDQHSEDSVKPIENDASNLSKTTEKDKEDKKSLSKSNIEPNSSPEKKRSSYYNDSRHLTIPWGDLTDKPLQKQQEDEGDTSNHRRSEIIPRRQGQITTGQARAVSQTGCRHGKNVLAPAYGNLVGRVNNGEWGC